MRLLIIHLGWAPRVHQHKVADSREIIQSKNQDHRRIKQALNGKLTKKGGHKLTNIENNTVAFPYKSIWFGINSY